ncbi:MAG: hypothetical protein NTW26_00150 [bacterium]|nr:hypothetical protein [bacterium]
MNVPDDSGSSSTRDKVSRLLTGLIERAEREIEKGQLTIAKPGDLLDAARMLLELDGSAEKKESEDVGRGIVERLRSELGVGDDEP